jgi:NAD(P)-dependent dehydrogenase (short-subunit alcohol dehydrogenase family)
MKYALISGALSGLAQVAIQELLARDYLVFAADKEITKTEVTASVHYLPLDVSDQDSIQMLAEHVREYTEHLDLVANFAGVVILGSLVEGQTEAMSRIMEINLGGMYRINNVFFPLIEKARGRIINISSEYGRIDALPFHTFYTASKHAVEIYNDGLRREVQSLGVKVVGIRPGAFKTKMQGGVENQFSALVSSSKHYQKPLLKMKKLMTKELNKALAADFFRKTFRKAAFSHRPHAYYNVNNSLKMKLFSLLPRFLQDAFFRYFFK